MSGNPITIRSLGPEDAFVLDRVRPGTFDEPLDPARVWAFLATRVNELVVAMDGGEVVGFAFGTVLMRPDKPTEFLINEIGVHDDVQRQGIAKRLIERLNILAQDRGCETVWVLTERDNQAAQGLYQKFSTKNGTNALMYDWALT